MGEPDAGTARTEATRLGGAGAWSRLQMFTTPVQYAGHRLVRRPHENAHR